MKNLGFNSIADFNVERKKVLLRLDINSPLDPITKKIVNENRIDKSLETLSWLLDNNAAVAIIAHQGDTLDYQNLIPLFEHAEILAKKLGRKVSYIDDVCGPAALKAVDNLKFGECIILGNLRYLTEEVSTFENSVKLTPNEMKHTYLVRSLASHFDLYVNDAFSAAHRLSPSMVAFQQLLPSAAGFLFFKEISNLNKIMENPEHPVSFVLGGAKISDAFGMINQVLNKKIADKILTCGVTGQVFLLASGFDLGKDTLLFLKEKNLLSFIDKAKLILSKFADKVVLPLDLAYEENGKRKEVKSNLPNLQGTFLDIGNQTIKYYEKIINSSKTIFVNGPAGVYEDKRFEEGTKKIWTSISHAEAFTCIGGGDSVNALMKFTDPKDYNYICTAGGAMVRFLSGKQLPLITAMKN
ncbi:MAG: phosphoglycerate kinase [Sphaerochaetaceae bacterium]|nr:phosphoglycerate kinase [Sphaerochaetaceae bacterium]